MIKTRLVPCLWFDDQAEEAATVLHRDLPQLEDHVDHPLRRGRRGAPPAGRAR